MAQVGPLAGSGWRFAAHLGISQIDAPLLATIAGSVDPVEQIACAGALGFSGITDNGLKLRSPETQRRMGAALRQHGLELGTFTHNMLGSDPPFFWGGVIPDVAAALEPSLAAAERAGGGCINLVMLDAGTAHAEQIERATENLARAEELATARGIAIAVEVSSRERVPLSLMEKVEEVSGLVRATGSPRLGMILDSCHCYCAGDDMAAAIRSNADRLAAVQLADMPGRVEPGAGGIAFAPIMAALAEIGWQGLVEAEFNPASPGQDGEGAAIEALQIL